MPSSSSTPSGFNFDVINYIKSPAFAFDVGGARSFFNSEFEGLLGLKELRNMRRIAAIKSLIQNALKQRCVQSDAVIFSIKIRKCVIDSVSHAKKDLNLQIHKFLLHNDNGEISGYLGFIQFISQEVSDSPPLTNREIDILNLISKGLVTKEIANLLGNSIYTIANHQKSIYKKLSAHTKIAAINEGKKRGLLDGQFAP